MEGINLNRGYISLTGTSIETIVKKTLHDVGNTFNLQKKDEYHVTLFTKAELQEIKSNGKDKTLSEKIKGKHQQIVSLGLGGTNGVYFNVILWPFGDKLRKEFSFPKKSFHITLSEKDDHVMDKSFTSLQVPDKLTTEDVIRSLESPYVKTDTPLLEHLYTMLNEPTEKIFFIISQYQQSDIQFVSQEYKKHPDWIAPSIRYGDISFKNEDYKSAMIFYMYGRKVSLSRMHDRKIDTFLHDRIIACSHFTEWGPVFTEDEMKRFDAMESETKEDIKKAIKGLYLSELEDIELKDEYSPTLQLESRERSLVLDKGTFFPTKLPRFFRWIIPFTLSVMSTPKNEETIDILSTHPFNLDLIVTLTEEEPLPASWFENKTVKNLFLPVPNYKAPTFAQIDYFIDFITSGEGKRTLVHCGGGKGRAGTFIACYLAACGFSRNRIEYPAFECREIIKLVRNIRPGSIETEEQEEFIGNYISHLWKRTGDRNCEEEPDEPLEIKGIFEKNPSVIILCGIQGSGKSYLAERMRGSLNYEVISQDELGSKDTCFTKLHECVKKKKRIIIDKCNPTIKSRAEILDAVFKPKDVMCIFFDFSPSLCISRADSRTNHPTIKQGRASVPVKSMFAMLQKPEVKEGFKSVVRVPSTKACDDLLFKLGCRDLSVEKNEKVQEKTQKTPNIPPEVIQEEKKRLDIYKFPRTRHLFNFGSASRDDLILDDKHVSTFLGTCSPDERIILQEKIDGANMGISIDKESLSFKVQNRSHYVNSKSHAQFKPLDKWLVDNKEDLWSVLTHDNLEPGRLILYGEWLVARHSIHYERIPDIFVVFDLYDVEKGSFYSTKKLHDLLSTTNLSHLKNMDNIPDFNDAKNTKQVETIFKNLVTQKSSYYDGPVEGIYVRRENTDYLIDRAKVVRPDFICGNEQWSKGIITLNGRLFP